MLAPFGEPRREAPDARGSVSRTQRRFFQLGLVGAITLLAAASLAWACTPDSDIDITPGVVPAGGAAVTVNGTSFVDGAAVQLRWNAADGPVLATTTARGGQSASFSVPITVPRVPEDEYTVVAITEDYAGNEFVARAQVIVGDGTASAGPSDRRPASGTERVDGGERGGRTSAETTGAAPETAAGGQSAAPAAPAAPAPVTAASPSDGVVAAAAATVRDPAEDGGSRAAAAIVRPSERSAGGDLWGGFRAQAPAPAASAAAPEVPIDDSAAPQTAIGAALLALGLVALFGAFAVAELRRRRAPTAR